MQPSALESSCLFYGKHHPMRPLLEGIHPDTGGNTAGHNESTGLSALEPSDARLRGPHLFVEAAHPSSITHEIPCSIQRSYMKAFCLFAIFVALGSAQAQNQPGGTSPPQPASPGIAAPGSPRTNPGVASPALGTPGTISATLPGAPALSPVGALPSTTTTNGAGATINTVAGPCTPGMSAPLAPGSMGSTAPGTVATTGMPPVGATVGGATSVIGNTNLNSPGPAVGMATVAQPCLLGSPATLLPAPSPSPIP
jgi:hypothetical protein